MMRLFTGLMLGLLTTLATAQQIVYVDDKLRVGVRETANSRTRPIEVVITGTQLEVLQRKGNYLRIRTPKGTEGWVNGAYVTDDLPAPQRLERLNERYAAMQSTLDEWRARAQELEKQHGIVANKLTSTTQELEQLQQQYDRVTSAQEARQAKRKRSLMVWTTILGIVGLAFFILGAVWYRHRAMQKLGGLSI